MSEQPSYRQIFKATSIFGGVQVFNIIISIIRSKFIAILLGPSGFGVMALLNSTIDIISRVTNFGLGISAVKEVAAAYATGDDKRISTVISLTNRLVWITGLIGLFVTAILSSWLSRLAFGNKEYALAFIWLSMTLLFNQLSLGRLVVLQGLRKLNYLAKANLSGSFIGLFITIPLYYLWGLDGIVPGIIFTGLVSMVISWYFSGKVKIEKTTITRSQTFSEGKGMLQMGFLISLSGILTICTSYIVRIFINRTGGLEQVGLYNAGFAIINTYVGLIFNAMSTDYYPRLSAVASDNNQCKETINQQAEIALLILAPILLVFLIFINWFIILLYSKQFVNISDMIYWAALGMFFKAASWSISFIFLAKGTNKLFFFNELFSNLLSLGLNLIGYYFWGLTGLGISFAIGYLLYLIQVYFVSNKMFTFTFSRTCITLFVVQFGLAITGFLIVTFMSQFFIYLLGVCLIIISTLYSVIELDKRIGLKAFILLKLKLTL